MKDIDLAIKHAMFAGAVDNDASSLIRHVDSRRRLRDAEDALGAQPEERKVLGFGIANDGGDRRIAPKALDKFETQVRDTTRRTRSKPPCCSSDSKVS